MINGPDACSSETTQNIGGGTSHEPCFTCKLGQLIFSDMLVGVHAMEVILHRSQVSLERSKDTHIQWLELSGGMRRESVTMTMPFSIACSTA